jgi:hypothetical protein
MNFSGDVQCRRCGVFLHVSDKRSKKPPRFSVWSLLIIAMVLGVVYYFYHGVQQSMEEIQVNEARRLASQPTPRPQEQGLTRSQQDQQRAGTYGDAVRKSESISDHNKHIQDTEKAMQQASNSQ